jgi:outer membrane protein assembly factor BamC
MAEAVDLPMVLYNVPGRTVADMQHETALRLAQVPGIVGIKEATGNIERAAWLIKQAPKGFSIYSGDDGTAVALMLLGGHGNVSVTANVAPRLMHELCMAAIEGDVRAPPRCTCGCCRCTSSCSASPARRPPSGPCRSWAVRPHVRLPICRSPPPARPWWAGAARRRAAWLKRPPPLKAARNLAACTSPACQPPIAGCGDPNVKCPPRPTPPAARRWPSPSCWPAAPPRGLSGDKVDYRSSAVKTKPLEVPPDLTQLARDAATSRRAAWSAPLGAPQTPAVAAGRAPPAVAPAAPGAMRIERDGQQRWLVCRRPPEQLWPQVRAFWEERGFTLTTDNPQAGVMETDWAENRAKLPNDLIRNTLGRLLDRLYDTGERDRFRTRLERGAAGTEIYISHRGMEEVYADERKDNTAGAARQRPAARGRDPGAPDGASWAPKAPEPARHRAAVAAAPEAPPRARASRRAGPRSNRRALRPRLAPRRPGAGPRRLHRRRPRPQRRPVLRALRRPQEHRQGRAGLLVALFGGKGPSRDPVRYRVAVKASGDKTRWRLLTSRQPRRRPERWQQFERRRKPPRPQRRQRRKRRPKRPRQRGRRRGRSSGGGSRSGGGRLFLLAAGGQGNGSNQGSQQERLVHVCPREVMGRDTFRSTWDPTRI